MKIGALIRIFASFAVLFVILLLTGCANTSPRGRYLEQIEPGSLTNLIAYRGGTNLEIRYPFHGKDAYAMANWPSAPGETSSDYQYYYAVLTFDKHPHITRRSLIKHGDRLTIRTAKQWQILVDEVFQGLMPQEAGHGVLVLVQSQEIALYRDAQRMPHVVKLDQKPASIIIDHAFGQTDFTREAVTLLEKSAGKIAPGQTQFLFVTGGDSAFVLIDLRQRLIVFLSYPIDPDTQPSDMPAWFTLRALNSLVIRGFLISALKNPVTLVSRGLWHIGTSSAAALDPSPGGSETPPPLYKGPGMDLAQWEKHLDKLVPARRSRGRLEFFIDGEQFFPALIKSVENATRSVDVLVYIFSSDQYAVTIANVLKNRSSTVRVRVLMDEMGSLFGEGSVAPPSAIPPSFKHPGDIRYYLTAGSRVHVRASTNPWLTTDHRKCIIIDGKQAYVGGMNIGWNYRYAWHDMMVRLTGPVVGRLEKDYEEAWAHAGILGDFAYAWVCFFGRTHPRRNEVADSIDIRPLRTSTGHLEIYRAQLEAIRQAKGYIYIENAYFSDNAILRELIHARQRGVDVRVILPAKNDSGVMQTSNLLMANEMVQNGIRVYAYPGMTHVKAAIYDGWACLGSANMEKMSLRVSQELDVAFSDPTAVNRLKHDLFETDFARAREITQPEPINWLDSFVKAFADQI